LKYLNPEEEDLRFEKINDDYFLFLPHSRHVMSTNGQVVETDGNWIIIWSKETELFEFEFVGKVPGGSPLLPYFLKDPDFQKE
jgi:hypothetical protein